MPEQGPIDPRVAALWREAAAGRLPPESEEGMATDREPPADPVGTADPVQLPSAESMAQAVKDAWARYERYQASRTGDLDPSTAVRRPGPGSPEWYQAEMGMNCYWCGHSLTGWPQPVVRCPYCGLIPTPRSS